MTVQEIRAALELLQREKDQIQTQVDEAKRRAAAVGDYSDADWFARANHALRTKGRQIGQLQVRLGEARKVEKAADAARGVEFEREFIFQARQILPRALYEQIMSETILAMQEDEQEAA